MEQLRCKTRASLLRDMRKDFRHKRGEGLTNIWCNPVWLDRISKFAFSVALPGFLESLSPRLTDCLTVL